MLGRPAGARFVALTLRERLTRTGHTVHAVPKVRTLRVRSLIARPPVYCDSADTVRRAAERMRDEHVSAVLVQGGEELGIVTDADLREKILAAGRSPEAPVSEIMTVPVRTFPADELAVEASIEMMNAGIRHLLVVDRGREPLGVISAEDLMNLETLSPFALRRELARAPDEDALVEAASHLPRLFVSLHDAGLGAAAIGRVLALGSDTATTRLVDLAIERVGQPPVPWAWLALGSVARREVTLASDQDNALAYDESDDPEVDAYFARFAEIVNGGLARCGFGEDNADVLARDPRWRMSRAAWQQTFEECLESPDRSHLVRAAVAFDFRHVIGGLEVTSPLVEILRRARERPDFIARLARTATDLRRRSASAGACSSRRPTARPGRST